MKVKTFILVLLFFIANSLWSFEKLADGVLIKLEQQKATDAKAFKIQVCSENIIHVLASPVDTFSTRKSLMVDKTSWEPVKWNLEDQKENLTISTSKIKAQINKTTGVVTFLDAKNNVILSENKNGKTFTPAKVMGEQTYHARQVFASPKDEGFYGLGQHQNGIMNYKGHNVDLWQYNIIAVVPFLVSSNNYGILWDNNSRTKFGDIRDYEALSSLTLYNDKGEKGGLSASYYNKRDFSDLAAAQNENFIDYNYLEDMDSFPTAFKMADGSVRWSGQVESARSGMHLFRLYSSGYGKVWLNDSLVVDKWRQGWLPWTNILPLKMEAGKRYNLKIEWIPDSGQAYMGMRWLSPSAENLDEMLSLYSDVADQIDYYFIYGANSDQVISGYRTITGKAQIMPKWALGLWQCRQRYETQEQLLGVVRDFRKRNLPLDNIVQDWFYWPEDSWGDHNFDTARFPDPDKMVEELHKDLNTNIMISVWPKFYVTTKNYKEFLDNGWLYMRNVEQKARDWVGPGYYSTFYDPYSDGARELFWKQVNEKLFSKGFDAWWMDASEPDIHSNTSDAERQLRGGPTALGTFARYANTFSLMNAKGIYEGQRKTDPNKRVFLLTRSAFAGQQRFSTATWSGDIAARWFDLNTQISAGINICLSGIPYWTMDIGGFAVETRYNNGHPTKENLEEWRELQTRWFQFGAFCPLFRVHGEFPYREIFYTAPEDHIAYTTMRDYDVLRYRLMPYIYSLAGSVTMNDYTIMRGLVMDFAADKKVLSINDQFMFGPALLVNPVSEFKARKRSVYLPASCGWYQFKTGEFFKGGQTITADAPYSDIPLFVKEGSIIPFGPEIQYTTEKPADPIVLYVYTGQDGAFTLYEDENINYNYEKGAYSTIDFNWNNKAKTLTIGERKGEFPGMLNERVFKVVFITNAKARALDYNAGDETVKYNGAQVVVKIK